MSRKMTSQININEYDYNLPQERIAKYPLENRDQSKLLIYKDQNIRNTVFSNLPAELPENALLIFNNTQVIRARMLFAKPTGARIEIFCLEPHQPADAALAFQQTTEVEWICMVGNQKKWKEGDVFASATTEQGEVTVRASIIKKLNDGVIIRFSWDKGLTFSDVMDAMGKTPIPPYLERDSEEIDTVRYQTIYSRQKGSVAAPTAGLHFSDEVMNQLDAKGITRLELTLHVGAGTFKPVKSDSIEAHEMHTEHFQISIDVLKQMAAHQGHIIAVGTTSVRTLESLFWAAVKLANGQPWHQINQWDGFEHATTISMQEALNILITKLQEENLALYKATTTIMIAPGYKFRIINGLITNFHQPRSTLLLLIAALLGENWKRVYAYALENDFRFLSYGDSSLLMDSAT
ncbi:S-adenosylmethionine:tRNA ribosyltransferase-isomerase [Alkaliflexus imshenetskii]|uniref:S-adenosylmethionine:tRNA ribosyltransferase-isomerase n=1 Tax=Alkaliflexus imshenetskii TaxID=286730 RepID=UPI0004794F51|nr:S-adenosylmethionine:tRNA ribosyltransferase-isomerase [Alkaliflexus imshenetskii]